MAFLLRVRLDTPSAESSATMLEALTTMAGFQNEHTALLTYHFAKPDPENRPNHLEFTEVYGNEGTWWAHSNHSDFIAAYTKGFGPTNKFEAVTFGYGVGLQGKVKEVCDAILKCRYPQSEAGFVVNPKWDTKATTKEGDGPILLIIRIQAKDGNASNVLQLLSSLSECANGGVIVCHGSIPEEEKNPNAIELVEVCLTNDHLSTHLTSSTGKESMKSVIDAAESITCEGYGIVLAKTIQSFSDSLGLTLSVKATDAGYVLHPEADPAGK